MQYMYVPTDVYARLEQEWNAIRRGDRNERPQVELPAGVKLDRPVEGSRKGSDAAITHPTNLQ
jgi:hypothetical protein